MLIDLDKFCMTLQFISLIPLLKLDCLRNCKANFEMLQKPEENEMQWKGRIPLIWLVLVPETRKSWQSEPDVNFVTGLFELLVSISILLKS